jgi:hypothetical protein
MTTTTPTTPATPAGGRPLRDSLFEHTYPGSSWVGIGQDSGDVRHVSVPAWRAHGDGTGEVSAMHGWVIGQSGSGRTNTLTTLLLPGLVSGTELVLAVDSDGDALTGLTGHIARHARCDVDRAEQVITLAWAILRARQDHGWTGPTAEDPLVTLVITDSVAVQAQLPRRVEEMVADIGRLGRCLGVRTVQASSRAYSDAVVGGRSWRAQTRWVIGHRVALDMDSALATQSTREDVSLLGLDTGEAAVLIDGAVVARRAKVAYHRAEDCAAALHGVTPAQLHPSDLAAVQALWDATAGWDH